MTSRRLLSAGALLCLAASLVLALPAGGAGPSAVVLYPPDRALLTEAVVPILAFAPEGVPPVPVSVNGIAREPLGGEAFRKGEAALFPGMNLLQVGDRTLRVFVIENARMGRFELPGNKEGEPLVFEAYRLHPALDDGCEGCHEVKGGKLAQKDQKSACYACHDDFSKAEAGRKVFVHEPVKAGECTGCHDPHFAARPKLQKLEKGCLECHDPFPGGKSAHRPVAEGKCVSCHSPHAGPAPKQLLRPGNALCLGCHESVHERHRSAAVRGTATTVPDDFPRWKREELACLGCHAPHRSDEVKLLNRGQQDLCKTCHGM